MADIDQLLAAFREHMPVAAIPYEVSSLKAGLVIVDEVNGFATVGAGALAPAAPNAQVTRMIEKTDHLAGHFLDLNRPVLAFLDTHVAGKPEPPYPPHCEVGTGEENLVPALQWLENEEGVTLVRKDCINGFVGAFDSKTGRNAVVDWINDASLDAVIVVGICTDICVMDFVLTLLSARNHGMTPSLKDVVVFERACATYDLPKDVAVSLGLPETAAHPQMLCHHAGLAMMAARGAVIATDIREGC